MRIPLQRIWSDPSELLAVNTARWVLISPPLSIDIGLVGGSLLMAMPSGCWWLNQRRVISTSPWSSDWADILMNLEHCRGDLGAISSGAIKQPVCSPTWHLCKILQFDPHCALHWLFGWKHGNVLCMAHQLLYRIANMHLPFTRELALAQIWHLIWADKNFDCTDFANAAKIDNEPTWPERAFANPRASTFSIRGDNLRGAINPKIMICSLQMISEEWWS